MLDGIFSVGNAAAMVGWALLIFLPRWRGVAQMVAGWAVPALLSAAYAALVGAWWSRGEGGFGSLEEVRALFRTPGLLLAGWLHYLAFDLFVGAWIARESRREGVPHLAVVPVLALTFLFGPAGYLASLVVRGARRLLADRGGERVGRIARSYDAVMQGEPRLMAAALINFAAMAPTLLAMAIDGRTVEGTSPWLKPLKFEVSVGIYLATLGFFLPMAGDAFRRSRAGQFVTWGAILTSTLEVVYIAWRASRGEASHFNKATPTAGALYALMGVAALVLAAAGPVLAWGIARGEARPSDPTYRLAVVLGLLMTFALGATGGVVMGASPGHFVGRPPEGGSVLPLVGWSRTVGDLRVAHFLGLHAQQVVAAFGFLAASWPGRWGRRAVIGFAVAYAAVAVALLAQALAGLPALPA